MPAKKNPNANKKHTNYRPFIRYIEHHAGLVDPTVAYTNRKFNSVQKNIDSNYVDDNKTMPSTAVMNPDEAPKTFASQSSSALTKKEKDDARHADLHQNVKTKDYEDKDKIFLLKREIDRLQSKIQDQKNGGGAGTSLNGSPHQASLFTNIPMLTGFLLFGVALVASRFLARKLRLQRVTNSLLLDEVGSGSGGGRSYEYQPNEGIVGFELQEQQQPAGQQPSGGLFSAIASTLDRNKANQTTPQQTHGGVSYMAPSEQHDATIQFV